jgi:hypothetical protein
MFRGLDFTLRHLFASFNGGEKIGKPFEVLKRHLQVKTETLHSQRSMETTSNGLQNAISNSLKIIDAKIERNLNSMCCQTEFEVDKRKS